MKLVKMDSNNLDRIFKLLSQEDFKDPDSGLLFFPVYIFTYSPEEEYLIRNQIEELNEKLKRPSNNLNCLIINIYDEFIGFLKSQKFAGDTIFDSILSLELDDYSESLDYITELAESNEFLEYIGEKFQTYFEKNENDKVYMILYGFGSIFPYLRLSTLLKKTEKHTKKLKIITFYPGEFKNSRYSLFGIFNDDNVYRANHLNQYL